MALSSRTEMDSYTAASEGSDQQSSGFRISLDFGKDSGGDARPEAIKELRAKKPRNVVGVENTKLKFKAFKILADRPDLATLAAQIGKQRYAEMDKSKRKSTNEPAQIQIAYQELVEQEERKEADMAAKKPVAKAAPLKAKPTKPARSEAEPIDFDAVAAALRTKSKKGKKNKKTKKQPEVPLRDNLVVMVVDDKTYKFEYDRVIHDQDNSRLILVAEYDKGYHGALDFSDADFCACQVFDQSDYNESLLMSEFAPVTVHFEDNECEYVILFLTETEAEDD